MKRLQERKEGRGGRGEKTEIDRRTNDEQMRERGRGGARNWRDNAGQEEGGKNVCERDESERVSRRERTHTHTRRATRKATQKERERKRAASEKSF